MALACLASALHQIQMLQLSQIPFPYPLLPRQTPLSLQAH